MKLALDISTKTIGIALMDKEIVYKQFNAESIKKKYKKENLSDFNLYMIIGRELLKEINEESFDEIIIEEPLFNSANRGTVNKLLTINTRISTMLSEKYNLNIHHQNVNKVRSWFLKHKDITFKEEKDKKLQTIEVLNQFYGFDLDKNFTDAADAIMHLIYYNNFNNDFPLTVLPSCSTVTSLSNSFAFATNTPPGLVCNPVGLVITTVLLAIFIYPPYLLVILFYIRF